MGELIEQKPVKLVASIIFKEEKHLGDAEKRLTKLYGPIEFLEKILPFDYTDYYCEEMGRPLKRKLICFKKLIDNEKIAKVKIASNNLEDRLKLGKGRTVNIDPGYITEAKLVLLTTKDYTHRIYIARRIFAEVTLYFKSETFQSWPWTYPDYAGEEMISFFNKVRQIYMQDIRLLK